ncbi:MAG: fibronectin type III domain-containing protein [Candidatus Brocadiia bacterium]
MKTKMYGVLFIFLVGTIVMLSYGGEGGCNYFPKSGRSGSSSGFYPHSPFKSGIPPLAPSVPASVAVSAVQINVSWTDNADNEDGFKVERKTGAGGTYAQVAVIWANVTSYSDASLTPSTNYYYQIRAYNAAGDSAYTTETNATTIAQTLPGAPTELLAVANSYSTINLSWTDNSNNEDLFKVERKTGMFGTWAQVTTVLPNVRNYINSGLLDNTTYYFRVRAYNSAGDSGYSAESSATTLSLTMPNPPTSLVAGSASSARINLTWTDHANNEDGYKVERKIGAGSYALVAVLPVNATSFVDSGLTSSTTYYYRVRNYNSSGESDYSNEAYATTPAPSLPDAPTSLVGIVVSSSQVNVTWVDNADNEEGYKIERKIGAGSYDQLATVGPDVRSYSDSRASASTNYSYRVRGYNTAGDSSYSNEISLTTPAPTLPGAPTSLISTAVTSSRVNLNWTDHANNEDGFKIDRKVVSGSYTQIATVGSSATSYIDTDVLASTTYYYRVRSYNSAGDSDYSNEANTTTPTPTIPNAPTSLASTTIASFRIDLSWVENSLNEDGYKIERKTGVAGSYQQIGVATTATYIDAELFGNTTYYYRIRAYNTAGDSAYSNETYATTPAATVPNAPTSLVATIITSFRIDLTWTDNANNESGFKIERSPDGTTYTLMANVNTNVRSYSDTSLNYSTAYYYRVLAYNEAGDSAYSNVVNGTTPAPTIPNAPTGMVATAETSSSVRLIWEDNSTNESGFKIERKSGVENYKLVGVPGPSITLYTDTVSPSTTYTYRIKSYNETGDSAYSNEPTVTTPALTTPTAPASLLVMTVSASQINVRWTDNSDNESGFKIERKTWGNGVWGQISSVGPNVNSFADTGLSDSIAYFYRVRSYNAAGNSNYTNEACATTTVNPYAKTWGGAGTDTAYGSTTDANGNVYLTGVTDSFGAGGQDVFLTKYNSSGVIQWQRSWGGVVTDTAYALVVDAPSGNIYVAGQTNNFGSGNSDAVLLKYNSNGVLQWQKTWGGASNDTAYAIGVDASGYIYMAGNTASYGAGNGDAFLVKFDSTGSLQWQKTWGGAAGSETTYGLTLNSTGDIYLTGSTASYGAGGKDAFLLKFNNSGSLQGQKMWGGASDDTAYSIALDSSTQDIYLSGETASTGTGSTDMFLVKLGSDGVVSWQRAWGGVSADLGYAVSVEPNSQNVYVAGLSNSYGAGNGDALFIKFTPSGVIEWQKAWGGASDLEEIRGLYISLSNYYLAGRSLSPSSSWQNVTGTTITTYLNTAIPAGTVTTPAGGETNPSGTETSPAASESGAGGFDALIIRTAD